MTSRNSYMADTIFALKAELEKVRSEFAALAQDFEPKSEPHVRLVAGLVGLQAVSMSLTNVGAQVRKMHGAGAAPAAPGKPRYGNGDGLKVKGASPVPVMPSPSAMAQA